VSGYNILQSSVDASINFVKELDKGQALEARYVRRHEEYVSCYLSSQTACAQTCRMCHLTATGQTQAKDVALVDMLEQAYEVLDHYKTQPKAKSVHFNFMARGEPLTSEVILEQGQLLFMDLGRMARKYGLLPRYLISTIMPETLPKSLCELFPTVHPEIYYSLYSMNPEFRKRWLPRAMDPSRALDLLKEWQYHTKKVVKIHFALIEGLNDTEANAARIGSELRERDLRVDFALVKYNPPGEDYEKYGMESNPAREEEFAERLLYNSPPGCRLKVVNRIGPDVAASCGMFVKV